MKTAHAGLDITESGCQLVVGHLVATLDEFKAAQKEKDELVSRVAAL